MKDPDAIEPKSFTGRVLSVLGVLIRFLGGVLVLSVGGAIFLMIASSWTSSSRLQAYSECSMRRIENGVDSDLGNVHLDYCMAANGYDRDGCDSELPLLPSCFTPRWRNW